MATCGFLGCRTVGTLQNPYTMAEAVHALTDGLEQVRDRVRMVEQQQGDLQGVARTMQEVAFGLAEATRQIRQ